MTGVMVGSLGWISAILAQEGPRQTGPDFGKASPFGLIIVVLLLLGTFALVWSMNRHLRRLPESFDNEDSREAGLPGEHPAEGAVRDDPDTTDPPDRERS